MTLSVLILMCVCTAVCSFWCIIYYIVCLYLSTFVTITKRICRNIVTTTTTVVTAIPPPSTWLTWLYPYLYEHTLPVVSSSSLVLLFSSLSSSSSYWLHYLIFTLPCSSSFSSYFLALSNQSLVCSHQPIASDEKITHTQDFFKVYIRTWFLQTFWYASAALRLHTGHSLLHNYYNLHTANSRKRPCILVTG